MKGPTMSHLNFGWLELFSFKGPTPSISSTKPVLTYTRLVPFTIFTAMTDPLSQPFAGSLPKNGAMKEPYKPWWSRSRRS